MFGCVCVYVFVLFIKLYFPKPYVSWLDFDYVSFSPFFFSLSLYHQSHMSS